MIRTMRAGDIGGAMGLKQAAAWNQTPLDWERLLRLEPEGCFVDERDGTVAGSTTALRHGDGMAWLGMVLVLPQFRGQGIARSLVSHALAWLENRGSKACMLDATDMGYSLYERIGFLDTEPIERWERPPLGSTAIAPLPDHETLSESHLAFDRSAVGFDRVAMLRDFVADESVEMVSEDSGFAFGRPGSDAWFLGPCIATGAAPAERLVRALVTRHPTDRVFWDLLPANDGAREAAARLGFKPVRRLRRMIRGADDCVPAAQRPDYAYASAGFEFG